MTIVEKPSSYDGPMSRTDDTGEGPIPVEDRARVPYAMEGFDFVPRERYYDREFFDLEKKYLWTKTWQMAARLEEIPNPGDYTEYDIVGNSMLLVRQPDGGVKALHNACRHRATELAQGCGRLPGGQIVCPFHGWRWNLDGSPSYLFMEETFADETKQPADLRLLEAKVEIWAGMIWINLDHDAKPLADCLSPVQGLLDAAGVGNMRAKWWKKVILNANWKLAQEAFFEAYHVMQTHPQLLLGGGDEAGEVMSRSVEYSIFKGGHARFQGSEGDNRSYLDLDGASQEDDALAAELFLESQRLLASGQDAGTLDRDIQIFEGVLHKPVEEGDERSFPERAIAAFYEYSANAGIPVAPPSAESTRLWGGDIVLYPNYLMLPMLGNCLVYRIRPYKDDPEWCEFDVWSLTTYPIGQEPEHLELKGVFDKDDVDGWGLIPRQDFANIEAQQRGLHSAGYTANRLSRVYEKSIANHHHEVDRCIARGING